MAQSNMSRGVGATATSGESEFDPPGSVAAPSIEFCRAYAARLGARAAPVGQLAYTVIEILVVVAIIGILAAIAMPAYDKYMERARVAQAVTDISVMSVTIVRYMDDNNAPPDTLSQTGMQGKLDPWNKPYVFTNLATAIGKASARKDKNLNPINSDFDLYSVGKDGQSRSPLSPKVSQDDVIRARDGRFIGLAKDFDP